MVIWEQGVVTAVVAVRVGVQIVSVQEASTGSGTSLALHYTECGELVPGDEVLLNVSAVRLGLGTGGYHFVAAVLNRPLAQADAKPAGHMMKLNYTPLQRVACSVEEQTSPYHELFLEHQSLEGMPVLLGELHSMLPAALCWLRYRMGKEADKLRIAYIMTDGGALPLVWSEHVAVLERLGWLHTTITYGQAYGGKLEAVNKFSALLAAKHAAQADLCIVTMGPGIRGTGTRYGYSGLEVGELVNAVHALEGMPIVMPRISFGDIRPRHYGISHHTRTALKLAARCQAILPLPCLAKAEQAVLERQVAEEGLYAQHRIVPVSGITMERVQAALRLYPVKITSMGRGMEEDPAFMKAICAAAEFAWNAHIR
ncbi:DUF3866 family protein [Paenibacillus aestuarii]|uniref:DUF3866 family protein n=1 Tax=Paenibacillus aestuarii TaxID=516965 RepID=A0ABW0K455_9BACL|nr:DUF3866 family protein [Paenibacillus aestuarii]